MKISYTQTELKRNRYSIGHGADCPLSLYALLDNQSDLIEAILYILGAILAPNSVLCLNIDLICILQRYSVMIHTKQGF